MYKFRILSCLFFGLISSSSYGQKNPLSISIVVSMEMDTSLKITYKNVSEKEYILWMQDWRTLFMNSKTPLISFTDSWPLINFIYIYPRTVDIYQKFNVGIFFSYDSEENNVLYDSFKILKPQDTFELHLAINKVENSEVLKERKHKLTYIYSLAEVSDSLGKLKLPSSLFIENNTKEISITGSIFYNQRMAQYSTNSSIDLLNKHVAPYFKNYTQEFSSKKSMNKNEIHYKGN